MTQYASAARIDGLFDQARVAVSIQELVEREGLKLRRQGQELRTSCPMCGAGQASKSAFSIKGEKWRCWGGCDKSGDVVDLEIALRGGTNVEAARRLIGRDVPVGYARPRPAQPPAGPTRADQLAIETWKACRPFEGTLAETYLRRRGICDDVLALAAANLRFHPNAKHSWSERARVWRTAPAMVAQVVTTDGPTGGIHATYLDRSTAGKAEFISDDGEVLAAKRMWGPQNAADGRPGCAWLIGPDGDGDLVVSEGIETGLSVATLAARKGLPMRVVAALSLGRLQGGWLTDQDGCIDPFDIQGDPERPAFTWPTPADGPWREVRVAVDRDMGLVRVKARTGRGKVIRFELPAETRARLCGRLAVAAWKAAGAPRACAIAPPPGLDFNDQLRRILARERDA